MIIKGKSRSGPVGLAKHLGNAEKNEKVTLLETRGTIAKDLRGALIEMDAVAMGTRCQKPLYHAAISPGMPHRLSKEQLDQAVDLLEDKLGLTGHARVVVMHEKLGRQHFHVVWSRIEVEKMRSVSDSHNYRKHEEVARELERMFGHERVQGAHHEREGVKRPDRTPSRAELRQEERTGIKGKDVKREVTEAFRSSDGAEAFRAALEDKGYLIAKGDRRDFVIVDHRGGIHSLARRIDGMKAAELYAFMAPLDRETLPSIEEARHIAKERGEWWQAQRAAKREALLDKAYGGGQGYVSQTQTALRHAKRRQKALDRTAGRDTVWDSIEKGEKARSEHSDHISQTDAAPKEDELKRKRLSKPKSERMAKLLERLESESASKTDHTHDAGPNQQPKAPGGGRSRSR